MKVEAKNVKYAAFASEETMCFQAAIYIDGKKVGAASNDGHGGCTMIHPYTLEQRLNEYAKTLPKQPFGYGIEGEYQPDAGTVIDDLVGAWLDERTVGRELKTKILFTKKGVKGLYSIRMPKAEIAQRLADPLKLQRGLGENCDKILNLMPFAEAVALYVSSGKSA